MATNPTSPTYKELSVPACTYPTSQYHRGYTVFHNGIGCYPLPAYLKPLQYQYWCGGGVTKADVAVGAACTRIDAHPQSHHQYHCLHQMHHPTTWIHLKHRGAGPTYVPATHPLWSEWIDHLLCWFLRDVRIHQT